MSLRVLSCNRATTAALALQTKSEPWLFADALHRRNRCCFIGKRARPARTTAHACSSHGRFARAVFWTRRSRASFALFARASCTHLSAAVRTGRAHLPMKYENDSVMNAQASQATRTACSASRNARVQSQLLAARMLSGCQCRRPAEMQGAPSCVLALSSCACGGLHRIYFNSANGRSDNKAQ